MEVVPVGYPNTRGISVLEQLKLCLAHNIQLQAQLEAFLKQLEQALKRNADEQAKAEILSKNQIRYPKCSIMSFIKPRAKTPYFVDMNLKCPPPNKDAEEMKDKLSEVFINPAIWLKNDDKKLIVGVRQKNLERLSRPIQQRMLLSDVTIDELKELQAQITELKTKNAHQLLVHSDDLDWNTIAYEQFNTEHSAYDCYLRYKNFLQPSVNHKEWTPNEVWRLNELAKKHDEHNWEEVAVELNTGRTAVQCLRCYKTSSHLLSKNQWTLEEDKKLKKAVTMYGQNWGMVATYIGTRTSQQCTGRYHGGVLGFFNTQSVCSGKWSDEENERLKEAIRLYGSTGPVWTAVSKFVGTRNSTQCRERYRNVLAGQHLIRPWTENETKKLMDYCNEKLKDGIVIRWCEIARELDRRDDACRRRWFAISSLDEKLEMKKLSIKHKQQHMGGGHSSKKRHKVAVGDYDEEEVSASVQEELEQYKTRILTKRVKKRPPSSNKKKRKSRGKGKSSDPKDNTIPAQQPEPAPTPITIDLVQSTSTGPTTNTGPQLNQPPGPTSVHFPPGGPPLQPVIIPLISLTQPPPFPLPHVQFPPFGVPGVSHNPGPFPPPVGPRPHSVSFSHSTSSQFQPLPSQPGPSFRPHPPPRPRLPPPNPPCRRSTRIRPHIPPPPPTASSLCLSFPPSSLVVSSSCSSSSNSSVPSLVVVEEVVTTTNDNENV